jgi:FG-GAP-like repeat
MNGDGSLDIVALESDPTTQNLDIAIALGNGDGTFKTPTITSYAGQYVNGTSLAVADFNGDGKLDIATSSFLGPMESGIAVGNGDGTLQTGGDPSSVGPVQAFYVGSGGAAIALDLNGDGKPDISDRLRGTLESAWWRGDDRLDYRPHYQRSAHRLCRAKRNLYCYRSGALRQHNRAYRQCVLL